jgi:hypothetical protein
MSITVAALGYKIARISPESVDEKNDELIDENDDILPTS